MTEKNRVFCVRAAFAAAVLLAAGVAFGQDAAAPPAPEPPATAAPVPMPEPAPAPAPIPCRPAPRGRCVPVPPAPDGETVIVPLRYLDRDTVNGFAAPLGVTVYGDTSGKNVLLYGPAKELATVKDFVTRLDTPPVPKKNVSLTFYLVVPGKEPGDAQAKAGPAVIDEIAKLMQSTLGLTQFCLWDTIFVRGRDGGEMEMSGFLPEIGGCPDGNSGPGTFKLRVGRVEVVSSGTEETRIALDELVCGAELGYVSNMGPNNRPAAVSRMEAALKADINVPANRMEVVGKISLSNKGESALVIVKAQLLND